MLSEIRPLYVNQGLAAKDKTFFSLTPAATLYYNSETRFSVNCYLQAVLTKDGANIWSSRYVVNRTQEYSRDDKALHGKLTTDLKQCFTTAIGLFELHKENGAQIFREYEIDFGGRTGTFPVVESLLPNRLVYFDTLGLYELDRTNWRRVTPK